jgi:pyruvate dehydrogenase E1 component
MYYITLHNENYAMPEMPAGCADGIIRGMYRVSTVNVDASQRVQLFGSGAILREALRAQSLLAEKYKISSDVWSVTSYTELRRDAQEAERWNMLHPEEPQRVPYVAEMLAGTSGPYIAASDHVRALAEQLDPWVPGGLFALGTDGMGRSESRAALRRHFEVDAESITIAALYQLKKQGKCDGQCVAKAVKELGINPEKQSALYA